MSDIVIGRRDALGLIGGASALAAAPAMSSIAIAAPAAKPLGTTAADRLRTFMMMRGALDDRLVICWIQGQYFGLVDGEMTLLCGIVNATLSRYRRQSDGGYVGARGEISYITDPVSGRIVRQVRNPYTGAMVDTPARGYPPSVVHINPDLKIRINEHSGEKLENTTSAPFQNGPDVWVSEVNAARTQLPSGKVSLYNEIVNYRAKAADFHRPNAKRVPCDMSFSSVVSWRSWMGMGDRPGQMMAIGAGNYVSRIEELPAVWLDETRRTQPDVVNKPLAFLEPAWATLK